MEAKSQISLLNLPTEMLDKIFSFLETRDVRSMRRVNKRLNKVCRQSIYWENDVFHWKKVHDIQRTIDLLRGSKRSVFNLHIEGVNFEDNCLMEFFQKRGSRVHSLSFYDCNFERRLLQNIIRKCKALRSFSFIASEDFMPMRMIDEISKFDNFRKLEANSIVLEEVTSLTFVMERDLPNYLDEPSLRRFLSLFPNVIRLDIRIPPSGWTSPNAHDDPEADFSDTDSITSSCFLSDFSNASADDEDDSMNSTSNHEDTSLTSTSIYNCILMNKNLQWLRTNFSRETLAKIGDSFFEALPNLNYLNLDWFSIRMSEIDISKWRTPFRSIPWLEMRDVSKVVHQLNPKHLKTSEWASVMDSNFFLELLQSKVQTLEFTHTRDWIPDPTSVLYSPNTILTDLNIVKYLSDTAFTSVALFPEHFQALVHLKLEMVSNDILQLIFKNQKNLRSLYLNDCRSCDLYGFIGAKNKKQHSIRELQKLEHLTIRGFKVSMVKSKHFINAFQFPRLKYLNIEADRDFTVIEYNISLSLKLPITLFESMENLEALSLSNLGKALPKELKALCQNLKKLRYLKYDCSALHSTRICIVDLSEAMFEDLNIQNDLCYYDETLKKIVLKNEFVGCTFFSPKISSFVIDWIRF